jgi:hypothetical protein
MNRRNFLSLFSAGVAGIALEQAIPLGRVWSFPKKIVIRERIGSTMNIRAPQRWLVKDGFTGQFEIGDVVSFSDWPGLFVVSRIHPEEKVELHSVRQRLLIRGAAATKLTAAFPPDSSHTPS